MKAYQPSRDTLERGSIGVGCGVEVDETKIKRSTDDSYKEGIDQTFKANAPELMTGWASYADTILCVNPYPNGISLSTTNRERPGEEELSSKASPWPLETQACHPNKLHLRLRDMRDFRLPPGKYALYKHNYAQALEHALSQLRRDGALKNTVVYFGTTADPFHALSKKFEVTMNCLELLHSYSPAKVVIQTRSPMVISGLPMIKMMGQSAVVAVSVESRLESALQKYTPGNSSLRDRLVAIEGLRAQGIAVNVVVSPILPYGEYYRDAWTFAEMLCRYADYISLGSLSSGVAGEEAYLRSLPLARRLASDKKYRWLRPHAYRQLYYALKVLAPDKLMLPVIAERNSSQLDMFAA